LAIINKSSFEGNKKATELATAEMVSQNVSLTGAYEQNLVLDLENIRYWTFNMEISQNNWIDYLADGPWGLDYMKTETSISSFMIDNIPNKYK
jgi:hypothetical protein